MWGLSFPRVLSRKIKLRPVLPIWLSCIDLARGCYGDATVFELNGNTVIVKLP